MLPVDFLQDSGGRRICTHKTYFSRIVTAEEWYCRMQLWWWPLQWNQCQVSRLQCQISTFDRWWPLPWWWLQYSRMQYDGDDCNEFNEFPDYNVKYPYWLGDGKYNGGDYNTEECGYEFNAKHPDCNVKNQSPLGDGFCDGGDYNTEECSYDGRLLRWNQCQVSRLQCPISIFAQWWLLQWWLLQYRRMWISPSCHELVFGIDARMINMYWCLPVLLSDCIK